MPRLTTLALALSTTLACGDSRTARAPAGGSAQPPAAPAAPAGDPRWLARLPGVTAPGVSVALRYATAVVGLGADGALRSAPAPAAAAGGGAPADPLAAATPTSPARLADALGLPPPAPADPRRIAEEGDGAYDAAGELGRLLAHPAPARGAPPASPRLSSAIGRAHPHDVSGGIVILPDAAAPARALIELLARTGGFVAVRHADGLAALPVSFERLALPFVSPGRRWIEVRMSRVDAPIHIEEVPGARAEVSLADVPAALAAKKARAVDVLVGGGVTVGELVALIERIRATGVDGIGLGLLPDGAGAPGGGAQLPGRGLDGSRVLAWDIGAQPATAIDVGAIGPALDPALAALRACYDKALARQPALAGTLALELPVGPQGALDLTKLAPTPGAPLITCAREALATARLPSSTAPDVFVSFRLTFAPR